MSKTTFANTSAASLAMRKNRSYLSIAIKQDQFADVGHAWFYSLVTLKLIPDYTKMRSVGPEAFINETQENLAAMNCPYTVEQIEESRASITAKLAALEVGRTRNATRREIEIDI